MQNILKRMDCQLLLQNAIYKWYQTQIMQGYFTGFPTCVVESLQTYCTLETDGLLQTTMISQKQENMALDWK